MKQRRWLGSALVRPTLLNLAVAAALLLLAGGWVFLDRSSERNNAGHPSPPAEAGKDGAESSATRLEQLEDGSIRSSGTQTTERPPAGSLVIGWLEASRLVAVDLNDLLRSATKGSPPAPRRTLSPVVGAPFAFAVIDSDFLLAATNHKQLVHLHADWKTVKTISLPSAIGQGEGFVAIGSVIPDGGRAWLAVESGDGISIAEVDLQRSKVGHYRLFQGRFAGFPRACLTSDRKIALVWSRGLDLINPETLQREAYVQLEGLPSGVACVGNQVWVSLTEAGRGWVISSSGARLGSFSWDGQGSQYLFFESGNDIILGTDQEAGVVFSCAVSSRSCLTSSKVGTKPTDLLRVGNHVLVTLEDSQGIAVLDRDTLRLVGVAKFPGRPRALAYLP